MLDFRQLEAFVWVSELNSFSAAAEKLNTTQPTISQRIANLEQHLGTRVFERSARGMRLTDKGQELLLHAKRILEQCDEMLRVAKSSTVMQGMFNLGAAETLVHTWLPTLIERLHQQHPGLVIEIHIDTSSTLKGKLLSHQLDLALYVGRNQDDISHSLSLGEYPLAWYASPKLGLPQKPLTAQELGVYPIITYPVGSYPYATVKQLLTEAKVESPRIYGSGSLSTILHMIASGMGPGVLAEVLAKPLVERGELIKLEVEHKLPNLIFYAHWLDTLNSQTARTVARMANQIASEFDPMHK